MGGCCGAMKTGHKSLPDKNQPKKLQESNPEQANGKELPVPAVGDQTTGGVTNQDEVLTPTKVALQESEPPNQVSEPKTEINGHSLPEGKIDAPVVEELVAVSLTSQQESVAPPAEPEASEPQAASNSIEIQQLSAEELTRRIDSLLDPVDVTVSVPDDVVPVETGSSAVEITAEKTECLVNSEPPTVDVEPPKENECDKDPAVSVVPVLQNVEIVPPKPLIPLEKQDAFEVNAAAAPVTEEVSQSQVVEVIEAAEFQSPLPEPIAPEQSEPQEIAPQESTPIVEEFKPEAVSLPAEQQVGEEQVPEVTVIVTEESHAQETKEEAGFNVEEVPVEKPDEVPAVTQAVAEPVLDQTPVQSTTDDSSSQDIQSDVQTVEIVPMSIEVPEAQESVKAEDLPEVVGSGVVEDIATVSDEVSATPVEQVQTVPEQVVEQTESLREEPQEQVPLIEPTSSAVTEEEQSLPHGEVESVDSSNQEVAPSEERPSEEPVPVEQSTVSVDEPVQEEKPFEEPVPVEQSTVSVEEPVQEEKPSEEPVPVEQSTVSVEEPVQEEKPSEEPVSVEQSTVSVEEPVQEEKPSEEPVPVEQSTVSVEEPVQEEKPSEEPVSVEQSIVSVEEQSTILAEEPVQEQPTNLPTSELEPEVKPAEETAQSDLPNPILANVDQKISLPEGATLPESELPAPAEVDNGADSTALNDNPVLETVVEQAEQQRQTWWDSEKNAEETSVLEVVGEQGRQAHQTWWSGKGENAEEVTEEEISVLEKVSGDVRDSHQAWWDQTATTEAGDAEASDSTLEQVPVQELPEEIENVPVPDHNVPTPAINGFAEEHNDVTNADINSFPPSDLPPQEIVPNDYPAPVQEAGLPTDFPPPIQDDQISGKETLGFSPSSDLSPEPTLENSDPKSTEEPTSAQA